jgi:hypothetical protein
LIAADPDCIPVLGSGAALATHLPSERGSARSAKAAT